MSAKMAAALTPIYVLHSALPSSSDYQEPGPARSRHRLSPPLPRAVPEPQKRSSNRPGQHFATWARCRSPGSAALFAILMTSPAAPPAGRHLGSLCPPSPAPAD